MFGRLASVALLGALVSAPLQAHVPCYSENASDNFLDNVSMHGQNGLLAVKFTAPRCFTVTEIKVFTGEASGVSSVAIWTNDATLDRPGVQIASGSWNMWPTDSWQGGFLTNYASLDCNVSYWMVWGWVDGAQASLDPAGTALGQVYRTSSDGGQSWGGPWRSTDRQWKFCLLGNCFGPGLTFCVGDGSTTPVCPCGNWRGLGHGCSNSENLGGAQLLCGGTTQPDTLELLASFEPVGALSVFLQGSQCNAPGVFYGDGVLCLGGTLRRLYVKSAANGQATAPDPNVGDPTIGRRSAALGDVLTPGSIRFYQVFYRDPDANFCPSPRGDTWNVSGGMSVEW